MKKHVIDMSKVIMDERCISDSQWKEILKICNDDTIVSITSFTDLADCYKTLESRILDCYTKHVELAIDGDLIECKVVLKLIAFFRNTMNAKWKENQMQGIQRALDKKRNGIGKYGRPKTTLPLDFEEAIKCIADKEYTVKEYLKRTGMKKSTFYKYSLDIKQGKKI